VLLWTIPGELLIVLIGACDLLAVALARGLSPIASLLAQLFPRLRVGCTPQATQWVVDRHLGMFQSIVQRAPLLAAVGLLAGYVIYQLYFWVYWVFEVPSLILDPDDRGRSILRNMKRHWSTEFGSGIAVNRYTPDAAKAPGRFAWIIPCKVKNRHIMQDFQHNWLLADSIWYLALSTERYAPIAEHLLSRARFLGDMYHSAGTAIASLSLSWILCSCVEFVMYLLAPPQWKLQTALVSVATVGVAFLAVWRTQRGLRRARHMTMWELESLKRNVITSGLSDDQAFVEDSYRIVPRELPK